MSGSSLFQPSQEGFVGLWAPPVAGKLQFALKDIVQIYNSVVRQRQTGLQKSGVLASSDISKFQKHVQNFLGAWQYRYDKIKDLHRIQPVHENADAIKPQFLAKWDERKSANAQDEFIREQYVLSSQLSHVTEAISFADHYLQLYERAKGFAGFPKSKFNTAEEVETLHNILIAEYKYLAGCDVDCKMAMMLHLQPAVLLQLQPALHLKQRHASNLRRSVMQRWGMLRAWLGSLQTLHRGV